MMMLNINCSNIMKGFFLAVLVIWALFLPKVAVASSAAPMFPKSQTENIMPPNDMVLIYGGAGHRKDYTQEEIDTYVRYTNRDGKQSWMFDGFLLLEIFDLKNDISYVYGYKKYGHFLPSALQKDWKHVLNYYMCKDGILDMIEHSIREGIKQMGKPDKKRQIYIGIPEPIVHLYGDDTKTTTKYWGFVDGKFLDFSDDAQRLEACKWYIDTARKMFKSKKYKNLELSGFYWVAEDSNTTHQLIKSTGEYLKKEGFAHVWIPYFNAPGYDKWNEYGFTLAYHQPNYFFQNKLTSDRVTTAINMAKKAGLHMEMEFDERALEGQGGFGQRLRDYMRLFKEGGAWENMCLTYYQSNKALHDLKVSGNEKDKALYYDFCDFVTLRPFRSR